MILKFKRLHPDAKIPTKAYPSDSGFDVVANSDPIYKDSYVEYLTDLSFEVPQGYDIKLFPRGSISKTDLVLANSIGLWDQNFRGNLAFRFKIIPRLTHDSDGNWVIANRNPVIYHKGDKIGQVVLQKREDVELVESGSLSETDRNVNGWGSSGR